MVLDLVTGAEDVFEAMVIDPVYYSITLQDSFIFIQYHRSINNTPTTKHGSHPRLSNAINLPAVPSNVCNIIVPKPVVVGLVPVVEVPVLDRLELTIAGL